MSTPGRKVGLWLIPNAKYRIAQILGHISRDVYPIKPKSADDLASSVKELSHELSVWKSSLPPILGSINPSSLIISFRRQATVLKLAYSHAVMHANRPFLLINGHGKSSDMAANNVSRCLSAARSVLETVDIMAEDGTMFHAFWWTHYVTFCALAVVYVWEIQQTTSRAAPNGEYSHSELFVLAERCQLHLAHATASNSPSRRYSIILQELRQEAQNCSTRSLQCNVASESQTDLPATYGIQPVNKQGTADITDLEQQVLFQDSTFANFNSMQGILDGWQTADWLDIDSLVRYLLPRKAW